MVNLIYVPQMKEVAEFYKQSPFYSGESVIPLEAYKATDIPGRVLVLGRNGKWHHQDLDHIDMLQSKDIVSPGKDLSLVLFDRHTDYLYDQKARDMKKQRYLNCGSWVSKGIIDEMFSNIIMIGQESKNVNGYFSFSRRRSHDLGQIMKWLDEVELYLAGNCLVADIFYPEVEHLLLSNPSVENYDIIEDGKYVMIKFKPFKEVNYSSTKSGIIASTDLDVLDESEMVVDFAQGGLKTEQLVDLIDGMPTKLEAAIVSGFTELPRRRDQNALTNLSRILNAYTEVLRQSEVEIVRAINQ
ncbi:hypothetical protein ACFL0W_03665 [Nanoarchaeota archaeon]